MTTNPKEVLREYLLAYHDANPGRVAPSIFYEKGWWRFYDSVDAAFHRRPYSCKRTKELLKMTERLVRNAA